MTEKTPSDVELKETRVAMIGIIAGLVFTSAGMVLRSPLLGALAFLSLTVVVIFRRPLARLLPPR